MATTSLKCGGRGTVAHSRKDFSLHVIIYRHKRLLFCVDEVNFRKCFIGSRGCPPHAQCFTSAPGPRGEDTSFPHSAGKVRWCCSSSTNSKAGTFPRGIWAPTSREGSPWNLSFPDSTRCLSPQPRDKRYNSQACCQGGREVTILPPLPPTPREEGQAGVGSITPAHVDGFKVNSWHSCGAALAPAIGHPGRPLPPSPTICRQQLLLTGARALHGRW